MKPQIIAKGQKLNQSSTRKKILKVKSNLFIFPLFYKNQIINPFIQKNQNTLAKFSSKAFIFCRIFLKMNSKLKFLVLAKKCLIDKFMEDLSKFAKSKHPLKNAEVKEDELFSNKYEIIQKQPLLNGQKTIKIYSKIYDEFLQTKLKCIANNNQLQTNFLFDEIMSRIKNIKNKTERIESKLYDSFIQNVKKLIRKKIQLVVSGMNQYSAMEFKMIRINYLAFFKNEGTNIDENMFSLENLVKLDLLSLFFKANSHYRYQYHTNQLNVISSKALVSILQLQKSQFKCYSAAFLEMEQWLDYKFQKEFEAIITIVSFIWSVDGQI